MRKISDQSNNDLVKFLEETRIMRKEAADFMDIAPTQIYYYLKYENIDKARMSMLLYNYVKTYKPVIEKFERELKEKYNLDVNLDEAPTIKKRNFLNIA